MWRARDLYSVVHIRKCWKVPQSFKTIAGVIPLYTNGDSATEDILWPACHAQGENGKKLTVLTVEVSFEREAFYVIKGSSNPIICAETTLIFSTLCDTKTTCLYRLQWALASHKSCTTAHCASTLLRRGCILMGGVRYCE